MKTLQPIDVEGISSNERKRRVRAFHRHLNLNHPLSVKVYTTLGIGSNAALSANSVAYVRTIQADGTILATADGRTFRIRIEELPGDPSTHESQPAVQAQAQA